MAFWLSSGAPLRLLMPVFITNAMRRYGERGGRLTVLKLHVLISMIATDEENCSE